MLLAETIHIGIVGSRRRDTARDLQEVRHALITEMSKYAEKEIVIVSGGSTTNATPSLPEIPTF